jgi:hypothetical protein
MENIPKSLGISGMDKDDITLGAQMLSRKMSDPKVKQVLYEYVHPFVPLCHTVFAYGLECQSRGFMAQVALYTKPDHCSATQCYAGSVRPSV